MDQLEAQDVELLKILAKYGITVPASAVLGLGDELRSMYAEQLSGPQEGDFGYYGGQQ